MNHNWNQRIDQNTALYLEYFGSLNWQTLNQKPDENSWSIGQIIDHVNKLNEDYFKIFSSLKAGELSIPFLMRSRFIADYFGNTLQNTVEPERKKKTNTMKIWEPTNTISNDVIDRFEENQQRFSTYLRNLESHISENPIIHSPLSKWIVLPLNTAIEVLIEHELRHFNQAKELLGAIEKSKMAT